MNKELFLKLMNLFQENRNLFFSVAFTLLLLGLIAFRFWDSDNLKNARAVEIVFAKFEQSGDLKLLSEIHKSLKDFPALHSSYSEKISQKLLTEGKEPPSYFTPRSMSPYFSQFDKSSLLIVQNDFKEALKESLTLKERIIKEGSLDAETKLFACNLLRIAVLQKALNMKEEKGSLKELSTFLNGNPTVLAELNSVFNVNQLKIKDYIDYRLKK